MKTLHPNRPITLTVAALLCTVLASATTASATTYSVCASGCDYASIQVAVDASSSGDILELEPETFTEGNIRITHHLTLRTTSGFATIDAAGADFVLKVLSSEVDLENMKLQGAAKAMLLNHGTMQLSTVYIIGDSFDTTYGGIFNGVAASLTLTDASVVAGNASANYGGGITNYGDLTIHNSTVMANHGRFGGGVLNRGGQVSVTSSSFSFNHADIGGAWYNDTIGSLIFHTSSSYSGNTAPSCAKYRNVPLGQCVN